MNYKKLNEIKFDTTAKWKEVQRDLGNTQRHAEQMAKNVETLMYGVAQVGIEDIPISVREMETVYGGLQDVMTQAATAIGHLKDLEIKGKALIGHGVEAAESTVDVSEALARLELSTLKYEQKSVLLITAYNTIKEIVAADDKASYELLNLIGPERVSEWLEIGTP